MREGRGIERIEKARCGGSPEAGHGDGNGGLEG